MKKAIINNSDNYKSSQLGKVSALFTGDDGRTAEFKVDFTPLPNGRRKVHVHYIVKEDSISAEERICGNHPLFIQLAAIFGNALEDLEGSEKPAGFIIKKDEDETRFY